MKEASKRCLLSLLVFIAGTFFFPVLADGQEDRDTQIISNRSTVAQSVDGRKYYFHAVLQGQTLYSIARAYGVEEQVILDENPDIRDGLRYDQIIRIPVADELEDRFIRPEKVVEIAPEPDGDFVVHQVQSQETLFGLARQYGVSQETILFYNPSARHGLQIGEVLRIPLPEEEALPEGMRLHTVEAGETVYGLARQAGVSVEELEGLNPHIVEGLKAGQQVLMPVDIPVAEEPGRDPARSYIFLPPAVSDDAVSGIDPYCLDPERQDRYHAALLIPLYLDGLLPSGDSLPGADHQPGRNRPSPAMGKQLSFTDDVRRILKDIPADHKVFSFLTYYHGVLLALDSIHDAGGNISLHVYDVCQDTTKARDLMDRGILEKMDLIIGPFHRQSLDLISSYAEQKDIAVVSPLLPDQDQLFNRPNVFKVSPSLSTMLSEVAGYVAQHYPKQNILFIHNRQPEAAQIIQSFRDTLHTRVAMVNHFYDSLNLSRIDGYFLDGSLVGSRRVNVPVMQGASRMPVAGEGPRMVARPDNVRELIYHDTGMEGVLNGMRRDKHNVLITLVGGEPFLSDYLRQLHEQRHEYEITIFGIPQWQEYASIEIDYLQNLRVHFFSPFFQDYSQPHMRDFVRRYRQVFLTEPDEDAFAAAQTAHFFFTALTRYGRSFHLCMDLLNEMNAATPFTFYRPYGPENGWENKHVHIHRIQSYRRVDVRKPMEVI